MKKAPLIILMILFASLSVQAQYVFEEEKYVCNSHMGAVRLGEDVLGMALSAGGGFWVEINPTDSTDILNPNASNIFLPTNFMPGEYHFVFTAHNNPCLPDGEKALAKVIVLNTPRSSSQVLALCDGDAPIIDLNNYISPLLNSTTIEYRDSYNNVVANGLYAVPSTFAGVLEFSYTITDTTFICSNHATLSLIVNREMDSLPDSDTVYMCKDAIPSGINLNVILGMHAAGSWSLGTVTGGIVAASPTGSIVDLSSIDWSVATYSVQIAYEFAYSASCYAGEVSTLYVVITDNLLPDFTDVNIEVCKAFDPNGYVDLLSTLGMIIPQSSGTWSVVTEASPVDVRDGIFELVDARRGNYQYKFSIHSSSAICGLASESAIVNLTVFDNRETLDGEVQLCDGSSGILTLSEYVVGLPLSGVRWYQGPDTNSTQLSGNTIDVSGLSYGIHQFTYIYDAGPCGYADGALYISITDELTNFSDKEIKYCLDDDGSDAIDLDQVLGVFGVSGTWSNDNNAVNYDAVDHLFDGRAEGIGTYEFTFVVSANNGCLSIGDSLTVRIIITDQLN